ncbi:dual specificity phosphatase catalytic domain protein [Ruminococcus sp. CAG:60]|nr:dual specificity phosphatase catalytic domain protein [Ruminococcus sp. CAG:60]
MNLVDNVYLIVSFCRAIGHFLADFTDVVHTVVGCGIDLDHVHRGAGLYRLTHFTFTTGASIYRVLAVYCLRQYFCNGCLTGSSGAAEQIGVSDTVRLDLIGQRGHNVILALDIIEIIRSELPV